jgi:hypothetical protein
VSEPTRRKIRQLRALAASTTFPAEAASATAKADKLEAALGTTTSASGGGMSGRRPSYIITDEVMEQMLARVLSEMMERKYKDILSGMYNAGS